MLRTLRTRATVVLAAAALAVTAVASAQSGATQPATPSATAATQPTMAQLQREAMRLTLIARLPAADRQQATQLLDRADALRQRAQDLRRQELQAYVDALKGGSAPAAARAEAQQKVASQRTALVKDRSTLRSDVQSFVQKVPQARALMAALRLDDGARSGLANPNGGPGAASPWGRGQNPGSMAPGRRAPGQTPGQAGPGRYGRGWASPGRNGRGGAFGRDDDGWGRGFAPYGMERGYGGPGSMGPGSWGPGSMERGFMAPGRRYPGRMAPDGMNPYRMGPGGTEPGWGMPWGRPNGTPPSGTQPNGTQPNGAPQNSTPQNSTPPADNGTGGA